MREEGREEGAKVEQMINEPASSPNDGKVPTTHLGDDESVIFS